MSNIIIVEDEEVTARGLRKIIKEIDDSINVIIKGFAKEALEVSKDISIDAFLLDIQLKDYNGIELARQIREMDCYKLNPIVFITAIPTRELIAFKEIHCYDYIIKPFTEEEVRETLQTIINHGMKKEEKVLRIEQNGFFYVIKLDDIICIEANNKKTVVETVREKISVNISLVSILAKLSDDFIQCHRSYVINKKYIKCVDKKECLIELQLSDKRIPFSKKYKRLIVKSN